MISTKTWPVFLLALARESAIAADAAERKFIRKGMWEGEVVLKIGKPDHEVLHRDVRGELEERARTYSPHARYPQMATGLWVRESSSTSGRNGPEARGNGVGKTDAPYIGKSA